MARELTVERYVSRRKKPGPTAKYRAKRKRADDAVTQTVRAACVERDGDCRICEWENNPTDIHEDDLEYPDDLSVNPSEWAHLNSGKRAKTRGMQPSQRHSVCTSLMLCRFHHDRYDGRQHPRITITELDPVFGADGSLEIRTIR